jgi:hypothetical protein
MFRESEKGLKEDPSYILGVPEGEVKSEKESFK